MTLETAEPSATLALSNLSIAADRNSFGALVTASYMPTVAEARGLIDITIKVDQPGANEDDRLEAEAARRADDGRWSRPLLARDDQR